MRHLLTVASIVLVLLGQVPARAQALDPIIPLPDPLPGTAPDSPSQSQQTYDAVAIRQLLKLIDLSRLIGGGISQTFTAIKSQTNLLQTIMEAQSGTKVFPLNNGVKDQKERDGGVGLNDMTRAALNGAPVGPEDVIAALNRFRPIYKLDETFALKSDTAQSMRLAAQASAQGAIAASTAEASYRRANASMQRMDGYIQALQGSADLKTSVDINTRVMIEVAQQLNETLRTQSTLASSAGTYFMLLSAEVSEPDFMDGLKNFNR